MHSALGFIFGIWIGWPSGTLNLLLLWFFPNITPIIQPVKPLTELVLNFLPACSSVVLIRFTEGCGFANELLSCQSEAWRLFFIIQENMNFILSILSFLPVRLSNYGYRGKQNQRFSVFFAWLFCYFVWSHWKIRPEAMTLKFFGFLKQETAHPPFFKEMDISDSLKRAKILSSPDPENYN